MKESVYPTTYAAAWLEISCKRQTEAREHKIFPIFTSFFNCYIKQTHLMIKWTTCKTAVLFVTFSFVNCACWIAALKHFYLINSLTLTKWHHLITLAVGPIMP